MRSYEWFICLIAVWHMFGVLFLQMLPILFHKRVILCPPFSLTCSTMFMLFLRFCSYFLLVVLWLSQFFHVYPMIFMFCSMVFLWCSCVFPWFLLRFSYIFSYVFPTFSRWLPRETSPAVRSEAVELDLEIIGMAMTAVSRLGSNSIFINIYQ